MEKGELPVSKRVTEQLLRLCDRYITSVDENVAHMKHVAAAARAGITRHSPPARTTPISHSKPPIELTPYLPDGEYLAGWNQLCDGVPDPEQLNEIASQAEAIADQSLLPFRKLRLRLLKHLDAIDNPDAETTHDPAKERAVNLWQAGDHTWSQIAEIINDEFKIENTPESIAKDTQRYAAKKGIELRKGTPGVRKRRSNADN